MTKMIRDLLTKYREIIVYLVFGVMTTLVNYLVYIPCLYFGGMPASVANMISWVVAVLFAFLTNKPLVFRSFDWSLQTVIPELIKFTGTRVGSGLLETLILFVCVDILKWNGIVWKLITSVLVVILNYIGSKFLVFRKK